MKTKPSYLTQDGAEKLRVELESLKGPARKALAERLRIAISQGDLSENADYIQAKEDQGFLEGRIQELTQILNNFVLIDENSAPKDLVDIGSTVTIQEENYPPETYFLVGPQEADPTHGRISHKSPIGEAMLGHKVGEQISAQTPVGEIKFKIMKIE